MKITIKPGDTIIEYEEDTVPLKNDSLYRSDMTLNMVKSLADKVIEIGKSRYDEGDIKMGLIKKFKHYLKYKLAGEELNELYCLKQRIKAVGVYNAGDAKARAISAYLLDIRNYPYQFKGARGSIEDFREYYKTLK